MQTEQHDLQQVRRLFLMGLGVVFLCAFASVAVQIDGLIGSDGIMPAADFLVRAREHFGDAAAYRVPSIFWLGASSLVLHLLCALGLIVSLLLISGFAPRLCIAALWVFYLSIISVGGVFFGYQWDILLIEAAACAFFFAPSSWTPAAAKKIPTSRLGLFLVRFLLARLYFLSGATKWLSGDPSWRDGSALQFHFWTQPLPAIPAWWADRMPDVLLQGASFGTLFIELGLPICIFAGRSLRLVAFGGLIGLQLLIGFTGSYGFFNLLTCVLCLSLIEDRDLAIAKRWFMTAVGARREKSETTSTQRMMDSPANEQRTGRGQQDSMPVTNDEEPGNAGWRFHFQRARRAVERMLAIGLVLMATVTTVGALGLGKWVPKPVWVLRQNLAQFHSFNSYGLFAVMTRQRLEIEVEGSADGRTWRPYVFVYKPGPPNRPPRFAMPHMPRLDWQMWFASLRGCEASPWFHSFLLKLLEGSEPVTALLEENAFPDQPPRFLRTPTRKARFSGPEEDDGGWWSYEAVGHFCPMTELRGGRLVVAHSIVADRKNVPRSVDANVSGVRE